MKDSEEEKLVKGIAELIGYGRVMQIASQAWEEKAISQGLDGSGFVIGPCTALTESCGCVEVEGSCEWCCGSGWLTKHVKELKDYLVKVNTGL